MRKKNLVKMRNLLFKYQQKFEIIFLLGDIKIVLLNKLNMNHGVINQIILSMMEMKRHYVVKLVIK